MDKTNKIILALLVDWKNFKKTIKNIIKTQQSFINQKIILYFLLTFKHPIKSYKLFCKYIKKFLNTINFRIKKILLFLKVFFIALTAFFKIKLYSITEINGKKIEKMANDFYTKVYITNKILIMILEQVLLICLIWLDELNKPKLYRNIAFWLLFIIVMSFTALSIKLRSIDYILYSLSMLYLTYLNEKF